MKFSKVHQCSLKFVKSHYQYRNASKCLNNAEKVGKQISGLLQNFALARYDGLVFLWNTGSAARGKTTCRPHNQGTANTLIVLIIDKPKQEVYQMTIVSLSQLCDGINQQIHHHETLDTHLREANALVRIGNLCDFDQISNEIIHHYFNVLMDIFEKMLELSEHLSQELSQWALQLKHEK